MAGPPRATVVIKGPKLDRPKVNIGVTLEEWNIFKRRWDVFGSGSGLDPDASSSQLFQCAGDELGDSLLKTDQSIVSKPTSVVMGAMKSLAVIAVATGVMRAELVRMQQERDESFRAFAARVRGKAETCAYITKCTCLCEVDFTDSIIRDVLIAGIADLDIRREVLGTSAILERAVNDVISLVEGKEMARNALPSSASGISSFKRGRPVSAAQPPPSDRSQTALCPDCKQTFALFSEGARGWNTRPHRQCIKCYRGRRVRRSGASPRVDANPPPTSEMGAVFAQVSSLNASCGDNRQSPPRRRRRRHRRRGRDHRKNVLPLADVLANEAHHIFTKGQWRRARFLNHPEVKLTMSVNASDYQAFRRSCPTVA